MRNSGQTKGVFCLEGQWDTDLRKTTSVRAVLELLRDNCGIDYIYRDCATSEEFTYYLGRWKLQQYDSFLVFRTMSTSVGAGAGAAVPLISSAGGGRISSVGGATTSTGNTIVPAGIVSTTIIA